jgi:dCTP deaminase
MILSNVGIQRALCDGRLEISPTPVDDQYTTSAVDLFLGGQFRCWDEQTLKVRGAKLLLDLAEQQFQSTAAAYLKPFPTDRDGSITFPPYGTQTTPVLAITRERVHLQPGGCLAARVEGRSSMARLGLIVHLTAPIIHSGFNGYITLEMINFGPFHLQLIPGKTRICQLIIEKLEDEAAGEIRTEFQHQTSPAGK